MAIEAPFISREDSERVRKRIAKAGEEALNVLAAELKFYGRKRIDGRYQFVRLTEEWVKNFKWIADQLRRDYRLDVSADQPPVTEPESAAPSAPADPFAGLQIVHDDEAA